MLHGNDTLCRNTGPHGNNEIYFVIVGWTTTLVWGKPKMYPELNICVYATQEIFFLLFFYYSTTI